MRRRIIRFRTPYYIYVIYIYIYVYVVIYYVYVYIILLCVRENINDDRYRTHNDNVYCNR